MAARGFLPANFDSANPAACKRVIAEVLSAAGLSYRLSARTISFEDLARGSMVFVTIHNWQPDPLRLVRGGSDEVFGTLAGIARDHGFRIVAG